MRADSECQIASMTKAGSTYAEIALRLSISRERLREILDSRAVKHPRSSRMSPVL